MSAEQVVTIITGVLQAGGVGVFMYYLIRGLRSKISGLEGTVLAQNETLKVMEKRISETEKVGQIYKDLLSSLPKDLDNYKAIISRTKDEVILELENAKKQKDERLKEIQTALQAPQKITVKQQETMKFLLEPQNEKFRKFMESLYGDVHVAVQALARLPDFEELLKAEGKTLIIEDSKEKWEALVRSSRPEDNGLLTAFWSALGWYGIFTDNRLIMSSGERNLISASCRSLKARLSNQE